MSLTLCWPLIIDTLLLALPALLVLLVLGLGSAIVLARRIERRLDRRVDSQVEQALAHALQSQARTESQPESGAEPQVDTESASESGSESERQAETQAEKQAESQALQDQRVRTLGRLSGNVVHEVNNLLGVVSNSMHLIQRHPAAAELQMPLAATQRAVDSGSQLTQALLRCARDAPMRPQVLALAQHLPDVHALLRSVLGRRIEVSVRVDSATAPVLVDGGELELALINLALDACDAMPSGGQLWLRACHAAPEDTEALAGHPDRAYVNISVSDDSVGDPSVGSSRGPGLGQAQRLCTRAGGTARQASTPGVGTTVSLLLPAWRGDDDAIGRTVSSR